MLDKLKALEEKFADLEKMISDPDIITNNQQQWRKYTKEHADLTPIVNAYRDYKSVVESYQEAKDIMYHKIDPELVELAKEELPELETQKADLEEKLKILLLPKDPNDSKNVIVEIRGSAGGDEAALFASDIFKMYTRYAETKGWKTDVMDSNYTDIGGVKEVVFVIEGEGAYSRLKYESGVHRVQRIPSTDSGGRIHTSTITVAVLPEAEDVEIEINQNDLRIDTFCSSGPGGQSVNTTQSAVRITHLPTGVVVSMQDEKSQLKNKDKAMRVLRARLLEKYEEEQRSEMAENRKSQVGTGDRSERIRTYNFPQSRVTDHRIGLTLHKLDYVLAGDLDEIIDALNTADQMEKLKKVE
ncbi:peptide chain release factor 1 [Alkalicella caledoniensis]|uniref:Peptide chain release factor 1 n=1 Tax=Alkalicella caledoniensis TaxID=2731377 RepID=A0A7G9W8X9_ALKCA|nr:peptide chain release factor 1 [Alkalicella caledoniensis]QNO15141.1 peptide chain release factor 1 [Alkalicella caledoniensis]